MSFTFSKLFLASNSKKMCLLTFFTVPSGVTSLSLRRPSTPGILIPSKITSQFSGAVSLYRIKVHVLALTSFLFFAIKKTSCIHLQRRLPFNHRYNEYKKSKYTFLLTFRQ